VLGHAKLNYDNCWSKTLFYQSNMLLVSTSSVEVVL